MPRLGVCNCVKLVTHLFPFVQNVSGFSTIDEQSNLKTAWFKEFMNTMIPRRLLLKPDRISTIFRLARRMDIGQRFSFPESRNTSFWERPEENVFLSSHWTNIFKVRVTAIVRPFLIFGHGRSVMHY